MTDIIELASHGNVDVLRDSLRELSTDTLNSMDEWGRTPLIAATIKNRIDVVRLLVSRGADCNVCGPLGRTALSLASIHGFIDITEYLVTHGATLDARDEVYT